MTLLKMQKILRLVPSKLYYQVGIITNEPAILDAVKHYHIEFSTGYPVQSRLPKYITFSNSEQEIIEAEIGKLFTK
jgi:hypothetical protein